MSMSLTPPFTTSQHLRFSSFTILTAGCNNYDSKTSNEDLSLRPDFDETKFMNNSEFLTTQVGQDNKTVEG